MHKTADVSMSPASPIIQRWPYSSASFVVWTATDVVTSYLKWGDRYPLRGREEAEAGSACAKLKAKAPSAVFVLTAEFVS